MALKSGRVGIHPSQVDPITGMLLESGGAKKLTDLEDVSISSVTNNQVLTYNNSTTKWKNSSLSNVARSGSYNDLSNKPTGLSTIRIKDNSTGEYKIVGGIRAGATTSQYIDIDMVTSDLKQGYFMTEGVEDYSSGTTCTISDDRLYDENAIIEVFTKNLSNSYIDAPEISLTGVQYNIKLYLPEDINLSVPQPSGITFSTKMDLAGTDVLYYYANLNSTQAAALIENGIVVENPIGVQDTINIAAFDISKITIIKWIDYGMNTQTVYDDLYDVTLTYPALTEDTTFYLRVTNGIGGAV